MPPILIRYINWALIACTCLFFGTLVTVFMAIGLHALTEGSSITAGIFLSGGFGFTVLWHKILTDKPE